MEALAEPQQIPAKNSRVFRFTKENAGEYARKATQARLEREKSEKAEVEHARQTQSLALPLLQQAVASAVEVANLTPDELYKAQQLQRARKALESLWDDLDAATEAKERKMLSDSIKALTDVEFALSGRSKPGLTRPSTKKQVKVGGLGPIDPEA